MQLQVGQAIEIVVNGEPARTPARTLAELLALLGHADGAVATALNGDFVARAARAGTALSPGDRVEIVSPRQGG
jgi:sulfur carrier protein